MTPVDSHAALLPTSPTTNWTVMPYPTGIQSDYLNDQQTGTEEADIVGEGGSEDLSGAYIGFNPGNTATNGTVCFRVRVGADVSPPGYKSEMHIGVDGNNDGVLDLFLSVDNSGSGSFLRIFKAGTGANISPSTTSIDNTPLFTYSEGSTNYDFEAVTATIDPRVVTSTNTHPLDLDGGGQNDFFLSFFFPVSDLISALNTVGITNITTNTLFRFVVASSGQPNSLNQDINGLNGGVNSSVNYTNTGAITPPISLDGQTNRRPNVVNDLATTPEDTTVLIPVLVNDSDPDGDTVSIGSVSTTNGTVSISGTNVVFTPATNYNGTVTLGYTAIDGHGGSTPAKVTVTVTPVNDAPVTVNDSYSVNEDTTLTVSAPGVLSNDSDVDGNSLTAVLASGTTNGTLTFNANGSFTYKPSTNFNGIDTFTYRANDGTLNGNTATVLITVNPVNDPPVAVNDNYVATEDTTLNITTPGVLANDTDIDSPTLSAVLVSGPTHGSVTLNSNGSFSYTPAAAYIGTDSFTYKANDGQTNSGTATANINVRAVNHAPVANGDSYSVNEDNTLSISAAGILGNDTDVDGDPISAVLISGPTHGSLTLNANGSFSYTPATNYNGSDSFSYQATDGTLNSASATVNITVNPVDDAPIAIGDSYSTAENTTLTVAAPGVLGNDTDVENDSLSAILVGGPAHGSLTLNTNGGFTYVPNTNFCGSDTFTYANNDGTVNGNTATVTITIIDTVAPQLNGVPSDVTVECSFVPNAPTVTATDSCDSNPTVGLSESSTQSTNGCGHASYTITRTWTATDASGNTSSATQTITVHDTTAPVIAGVPADATAQCDAVPAPATPTATDNCDSNPSISFNETSAPGACANSYTLTRVWTAADACGNSSSATQTITVIDTTAPVLVGVPSDVTVQCDVVPTAATPTATDNCDSNPSISFNQTSAPGACANSYTLTRVWTATDACGNSSSGTQVVTVVDTAAPVLAGVPADATAQCDSVPTAATPTATDNCDSNPSISFNQTSAAGSCAGSYILTRTWTATDTCGNHSSASQHITVIDTTAPTIAGVPADATVQCDSVPAAPTPTATDNCDTNATISLNETRANGSCSNSYTLTRTWTATDACGNSSSATQTITVIDTTAPVIAGVPADVTVQCDSVPTAATPSATDNCDSNPAISFNETIANGSVVGQFVITRTWTATDACGNSSSGVQHITGSDSIAPVLSGVPVDATVECASIPSAATV
ncbi:MAG: tandem-95 repeat protein, partial [Limisphaerales bacterium]